MPNTINTDENSIHLSDGYNDSISFYFDIDGDVEVTTVSESGAEIDFWLPRQDFQQVLEAYARTLRRNQPGLPEDQYEVTPTTVFETPNETAAWNLSAAQAAAKLGLALNFRYSKTNESPIETRRLVVENVIETTNGSYLVIGHDPDRDDDTRSFRIDRIKGFVSVVQDS
jgi:predicted DNA-binding transcriptional regulator YafY